MLTEHWAQQLAADQVVVNSVHPGWVDTPLLRSAGPMQGFYKCVPACVPVWSSVFMAGGSSSFL